MRTQWTLFLLISSGCDSAPKAAPADSATPPAATPPAAVTSATSASPPGPVTSATYAPALNVELNATTRTASGLYYRDLVIGTGQTVAAGQRVETRYQGWLADGTSFDRGTYAFVPGGHQVIAGWDEGVVGMKAGGKRQLIVPPDLGYGAAGRGPIPPNAVLVFVVEVLSTK